jgi:glycerol-3-phosphate dehydrogenase
LRERYGTRWAIPLEYAARWRSAFRTGTLDEAVLVGELAKAAMEEMAQTPDDLLWRRLDLGPRGVADPETQLLAETVLEEAARRGVE